MAQPVEIEHFIVGLDLGQSADYTALVITRQRVPPGWRPGAAVRSEETAYEAVVLKRYPLGTAYPEIVTDVKELVVREPLGQKDLTGAPNTTLAVDATGVGPPVVDMLRRSGLQPVAITITGGNQVTHPAPRDWNVPKRDLVSVLQVLFHSGRLKIAAQLPHAETLKRELLNFRAKISVSGHDTYEAWREGQHDDLVLALALACWAGEHVRLAAPGKPAVGGSRPVLAAYDERRRGDLLR